MPPLHLNNLSSLKNQLSTQTLDKNILHIERTKTSPFLYLNPIEGIIIITGISIPENRSDLYDPIISFVQNNFNSAKKIRFYIYIEYCNSSSSVKFVSLLRLLNKFYLEGKDVEVFWYQEEDCDTYADGYDFEHHIKAPFNIFELDEEEIDEVSRFFAQL